MALHPDAKPRSGVDRAKERIQYLLDTLRNDKETVIIPAPVLAEFLIFAGKDGPAYLVKIRESPAIRVEPFDERAAIELADMENVVRSKGDKRGSAVGVEWQKVKIDRQIIAIARVHGASVVYSDDPDLVAHALDSKVRITSLADLKLPPPPFVNPQMRLAYSIQEENAQPDEIKEPTEKG